VNLSLKARQTIESEVLTFHHRSRTLFSSYLDLFRKFRPRIVFIEDGHYGGRNAALVSAARALKIPTAEIQHGFIGPEHHAYIAPDIVQHADLNGYFPDFFLSYGKYWEKFIISPAKVVTLGNPNLPTAGEKEQSSRASPARILIISDGIIPKFTSDIAIATQARWGSKAEVMLRPHPGEEPAIFDRFDTAFKAGVGLDKLPLNESLRRATVVIGCASTVLFEALAFGCQVAVWQSPLAQFNSDYPSIFKRIQKADEITEWMETGAQISAPMISKTSDIWHPDWQQNFSSFLKTFGF
jgi:hypothetical protein